MPKGTKKIVEAGINRLTDILLQNALECFARNPDGSLLSLSTKIMLITSFETAFELYSYQMQTIRLAFLSRFLEQKYGLTPGDLLTTKKEMALQKTTDTTVTREDRVYVEPGHLFLFLGIDSDNQHKSVIIKLLSKRRILFLRKKEKTVFHYAVNFKDWFEIIRPAEKVK